MITSSRIDSLAAPAYPAGVAALRNVDPAARHLLRREALMSKRARLLELLRTYSYREGDFVLASGRRSSFYIDVRRTALHAEGAALTGELLVELIQQRGWSPVGVGGMTLGADPLTTATGIAAFRANIPWTGFLVRKEPKDHGTGKQVELAGDLPDGAAVVVLDDTVTTGGSTLKAVRAMEKAGFKVLGAACVIDRNEGGKEALAAEGVELISLFTIEDMRQG